MREFEGCGRSMRWYDWLAGLLLLWFVCGVRAASVYKCTSVDGAVAYQDRACTEQQRGAEIEIAPAPRREPSPHYFVPDTQARQGTHTAERSRRTVAQGETSFECRVSNGDVFYRHASCPHAIRAANTPHGSKTGAGSAGSLTVSSREVPRSEACTLIHRAGAIGRRGREHDEDVSTYERNLGRDPCR